MFTRLLCKLHISPQEVQKEEKKKQIEAQRRIKHEATQLALKGGATPKKKEGRGNKEC